MDGVHGDQVKAHSDRDQSAGSGDYESEVVEGQGTDDGYLGAR